MLGIFISTLYLSKYLKREHVWKIKEHLAHKSILYLFQVSRGKSSFWVFENASLASSIIFLIALFWWLYQDKSRVTKQDLLGAIQILINGSCKGALQISHKSEPQSISQGQNFMCQLIYHQLFFYHFFNPSKVLEANEKIIKRITNLYF